MFSINMEIINNMKRIDKVMPLSKAQGFTKNIYDFLIKPSQPKSRWVDRIYLGILFIVGLALWGYLLNWGQGTLYYHDWATITEPRLTFIQNAIKSFTLPLQSSQALAFGEDMTRCYLAIPDIILSPQAVLMWFMNVNLFSLFQVWIMYLIGFWGLLKLRTKFSYSPLAFLMAYLLFNLNGHLIAHISVGHLSFASCFLLSWFVYFVFELIEGKGNWRWMTKMSLLLFFLVLNGGYHQFIYCLFFFVVLALFYPKNFWLLITSILLAVGVCLFRILPEISILNGSSIHFIAGFFDLQTFLNSLIQIEHPAASTTYGGMTLTVDYHEITFYVGIVGAIFLFYFGLFRHLIDQTLDKAYRWMLLPMAALFLLSLDQIYRNVIFKIPFPIFYAERVSTRIFIIVFDMLIFLAANQFQKWLNNPKTSQTAIVASMVFVVYGMHDLWQNLSAWTVKVASTLFMPSSFIPSFFEVNNAGVQPFYVALVAIGLVGTLFFFGFLGVQAWRERKVESREI